MERKRFSGEQVIGVLKAREAGASHIRRPHAIRTATSYLGRRPSAGREASDAKRLRDPMLGMSAMKGSL